MTDQTPDVAGVILAGGRSRRMGQDKAWLDWHGRPLLGHIVQIVQPQVKALRVVARPGQTLPVLPTGVAIKYDPVLDQGPLVALRHAWPGAECAQVFVTGCDYPHLPGNLVTKLAAFINSHEAVVPLLQGQAHPLVALYRQDLLPLIDAILAQGERSLMALLATLKVRWIDDAQWRDIDPTGFAATNVNTPDEYERTRHVAGQG